MESIRTMADLIGLWPTLADFARDAGVSYGAAKQMRRRSAIAVSYWPALISCERGRAIGLSADRLMALHMPEAGSEASLTSEVNEFVTGRSAEIRADEAPPSSEFIISAATYAVATAHAVAEAAVSAADRATTALEAIGNIAAGRELS